jgi:hypothetical protein
VSTVAPAALVGELELQRAARVNERSPILPSPWAVIPGPAAPPEPAGASLGASR